MMKDYALASVKILIAMPLALGVAGAVFSGEVAKALNCERWPDTGLNF